MRLPGREARWSEPPAIDIGHFAQQVVDDGPVRFAFYGHSLGGLVAFEVARELVRRGQRLPTALVVGGSPPPDTAGGGGLSRASDHALLADLIELGGMPPEVTSDPELLRLVMPAIRADLAWADAYRWRPGPPVPFPIRALCGDGDGTCPPAWAAGWSSHTEGSFGLDTVPGGHFFHQDDVESVRRVLADLEAPPPSAGELRLPGEGVDLWWCDLDHLAVSAAELSVRERRRASRFHDDRDRDRFMARRVVVRRLLARYGCDLAGADLTTGPHGRPLLPDSGPLGGSHLSWSHAEGRVLIGLSRRRLGVDLETAAGLGPDPAYDEALARTVLHEREFAAWRALDAAGRREALLEWWTAKEAVLKAAGTGLSVDPRSIRLGGVPLRRSQPAEMSGVGLAEGATTVHTLRLRGALGALATQDTSLRLRELP